MTVMTGVTTAYDKTNDQNAEISPLEKIIFEMKGSLQADQIYLQSRSNLARRLDSIKETIVENWETLSLENLSINLLVNAKQSRDEKDLKMLQGFLLQEKNG